MRSYNLNNSHERLNRDWKVISRESCFEDMINILRMFAVSDKQISVRSNINRNGQRVYSVAAFLTNEEYQMICQ